MRVPRNVLLALLAGIAVVGISPIGSSQTGERGLRSGLRGNTPLARGRTGAAHGAAIKHGYPRSPQLS